MAVFRLNLMYVFVVTPMYCMRLELTRCLCRQGTRQGPTTTTTQSPNMMSRYVRSTVVEK